MKTSKPTSDPERVPLQGTLAQAVKKGHWILLDEINLAAAETLECLSGLLEGSAGSLVLLDRGDTGEPGGLSGSSLLLRVCFSSIGFALIFCNRYLCILPTEPLVRHPDFRLFACMNPATDVGKRNLPLGLRNR